MAKSPDRNTCKAELTLGLFQTVGVCSYDDDQLFVTDPANMAFYFYPADGDIAETS